MNRTDYTFVINQVCDYIDKHFFDNITLENLANKANLSKYHFIKIFKKQMQGKTPFEYLKNLRIGRSMTLLMRNDMTITEAALECGFSDISIFSREFKKHTGITPSEYREQNFRNKSQINDNILKEIPPFTAYFCNETKKLKRDYNMEGLKDVQIKELPDTLIAYVRYTGDFANNQKLFDRLYSKLLTWADSEGLMNRDFETFVVYHNDAATTPKELQQISVGMTASADSKVGGEIGKMILPAGKYAVAHFYVHESRMDKIWHWFIDEWFPASGYQIAAELCFDRYPTEPENGYFDIELCVKVR